MLTTSLFVYNVKTLHSNISIVSFFLKAELAFYFKFYFLSCSTFRLVQSYGKSHLTLDSTYELPVAKYFEFVVQKMCMILYLKLRKQWGSDIGTSPDFELLKVGVCKWSGF